jgi:hypothetical protein
VEEGDDRFILSDVTPSNLAAALHPDAPHTG